MYLSKPTLLCGLTFNCVKSQMKYIPLSGIWGGRLWRIGVRFSRDRCSHRRVRRGRGWTRGGFFRFLCRFVSFSFGNGVGFLGICAVSGRFGTLSGWIFPRIVSLCAIYTHAAISMLRQSRAVVRSPDGRGTVASKHYGKASLPGLERGWCHGWVLCCWWYGINSGITGGGLAHGPSFGTFPTTFCRLVGGSKESKQDRRD